MENQEKKSSVVKHFGLSNISIDNRTTVYVITAIIVLAGWLAYSGLPKEAFPEVVMPEIYINTPYPGNSPTEIEKLISSPLEKELNGITGVDDITSTSVEGFSSVKVLFDFSVTPDEALLKVKDKVDIVKADPDFPKDLPADPNVFASNMSEFAPVMNINLSGNYSVEELEKYAERLEDEIEKVPEINKVELRGVTDKEISIEVNPLEMNARELSFNDIAGAIQQENLTISGGDVVQDDFRRAVKVEGRFTSPEEISNVIIKRENQDVVYLHEIAEVRFREKDKESYAREFNQSVVMLDVFKRSGENLLTASDQIQEIVKNAQEEYLPENIGVSITNDQSDQTRTQVDELVNSIIFGVMLVVGVLLFFLGLRNAIFVGIAIPLSMLLSFSILSFIGFTLNVMVLFSLVMALGMLVDNGIVVVENIYRLMDEGMKPIPAAKQGVGEVALPIIASTATTLAAFFPLILWPGIMGEFMKYLPITLIVVLASSLFVALVINPVFTSVFMKVEEKKINKAKASKIALVMIILGVLFSFVLTWFGTLLLAGAILVLLNAFVFEKGTELFQKGLLPRLENFYEKFLGWALRGWNSALVFWGTFGLLIFSIVLMVVAPPKILFFPENEPNYLNVYAEMPIGTDIDKTNEIATIIEERVDSLLRKAYLDEGGELTVVKSVIGQVGNGTSDPMEGPALGPTPNKARINVSFIKNGERGEYTTAQIQDTIRHILSDIKGIDIVVAKDPAGPPQGAPIQVELSGEDYLALVVEAKAVKAKIEASPISGYEELKIDVNLDKPELLIDYDRNKARRFDLSTGQIGDALRTSIFGKEISTFKYKDEDYPINIRFQEQFRTDVSSILDQSITFRDPTNGKIKSVPISAVASVKKQSSFNQVKRKDLDRVVNITSNVAGDGNATEIVTQITELLKDHKLPQGVNIRFTGQQEEQAKEMSFLSSALGIAVFLILLIIVAQFNSISTPLIILFSVLFSLTGVFFGLQLFQMEFVIMMTMIGIISLAGVVVNNAIVLIDYTNLIRARKRVELGLAEDEHVPFEHIRPAIIEGGKTRLRPVLLTAITTVLGLFPLAVGLNIDFVGFLSTYDANVYVGGDNTIFWGPMSYTIIFGLTFATFLTLIVVPVMYLFLAKKKYQWVWKEQVA
ncbi:MAG: efflux RND transporter permease subunit [Flavobacteriales bacterium]